MADGDNTLLAPVTGVADQTAEATNAVVLNQVMGKLVDTLSSNGTDAVAAITAITAAITASIIGGTTGTTANAILAAKGTGGFALQPTPVLCDPSGNITNATSIAVTDITAYAVVCGGTTSANHIQPISSVGTSGQLLTSNGAGALPSMQTRAAVASDYWGNTSNILFITPNTVWNATAVQALVDATTIAVDMSTGFNFSVSIAGNRTLGNPTNPKVGQSGSFAVTASGGTQTLSKGANYLSNSAFPLSITRGQTAYVFYFVYSASITLITAVMNNPT